MESENVANVVGSSDFCETNLKTSIGRNGESARNLFQCSLAILEDYVEGPFTNKTLLQIITIIDKGKKNT